MNKQKKTLLGAAVLAITLACLAGPQSRETRIDVQADQVVGPVSRCLTGDCIEDVNHEIYGGIYSQMIFGESFQEPALAPSLKGFKPYGGRWMIRDGVADGKGLEASKLVSGPGAFKDGAVGVEVLFDDPKGEDVGLILRATQPRAGGETLSGYEVTLNAARQRLRLGRRGDNLDVIGSAPCEISVGKWISLEVKLDGPVIEILVDGKSVLRRDDGTQALTAGTIGLRAVAREESYRNLWVKTGEEIERLALEPQEEPPQISGMWGSLRRGEAKGKYAIAVDDPFVGTQSQQVTFDSGAGEWGVENQGLNRWGLNFVAGKTYEGCVWARAEKPATLFAALESGDGAQVYGETSLVIAGNHWRRFDFTLTPKAGDRAGRFALKLKRPGAVVLGYAFLQPGGWGRYKSLPVRRDVAEGLVAQGTTVLRYGGSMVNSPGYRWKTMIGPRDRRPPYAGSWYRYSSNGWGILDFMNFCEAAGFEYIPAFNMGETPQDMADFIEYAKGPADSAWGRRRVADGHPQPYRLHYLELGNEERVDLKYAATFEEMARAIWAKDPNIILVVGGLIPSHQAQPSPDFPGATWDARILAGDQRILQLSKQFNREVWFDLHVGTPGPRPDASFGDLFSFQDELSKLADGAHQKAVVFEFNAGNHSQRRALANALAILAIERDGRIPIATSANGLQPDGQNDNSWNQGLVFLNPWHVWFEPPGYATQMCSRNYLPKLVKCRVTNAEGTLDAAAERSDDGKTLVLQVVNPGDQAVAALIHLGGFVPARPLAQVTELSGPLDAVNTSDAPDALVPKSSTLAQSINGGNIRYTFPPYSFTIIRFE